MSAYECSLCGARVESPTPYPACPQGCRFPFERPNPRGGYEPTLPAEPAALPAAAGPVPDRRTAHAAPPEPERGSTGSAPAEVSTEEKMTGKGSCPYCGKRFKSRHLHIPRCPLGPTVPVDQNLTEPA